MSELEFYPNISPREMIQEGVFGGAYFGPNAGPVISIEQKKLIKELFYDMDKDLYMAEKYLPRRNKFKIRSGMPYEYWLKMNWFDKRDPYGWFEWYCKYSIGQRVKDDNRQIRRWQKFTGRNGRWRNNIYKKIHYSNNWNISPRVQQSLLHWGYTINREDYSLWCMMKNRVENEKEG